ncbi:MAG: two-component regulator propeller domain-containing protein [Ignavibacteria bacterium]
MLKSFILIILLNIVNTFAGINDYKSEHISLEEGISNNMIFSIYQDSKGFLWFGTMFGLIRYDGINYTTYRYDPNDSNSISNDDVISIFEDKDGYLWLGTYFGGLNRLDRRTGKFTRFIHNNADNYSLSDNTVWVISQDKTGKMWFGTNGGGLNKYKDNKFTSYKSDSLITNTIGSNTIFALQNDNEGNLWIGTAGGGLNKLDLSNGIFTRFKRNPIDSNSISGNSVRSIYIDSMGYVWAGAMGNGLNRFDKATGKFTRYAITGNSKDPNNSSANIFSIIPLAGSTKELWICTGSGLYSFDKTSGVVTYNDIYKGNKTKNRNIISACLDRSGVLWLSTYFEGLDKYYQSFDKFTSVKYENGNTQGLSGNIVRCFYEDINRNLWIGTVNGLNKYDKIKNEFTFYLKDDKTGKSTINSIKSDSTGSLWLGTDNGLIYFNPENKTEKVFKNELKDENSISSNNITNLLPASNGVLWVGTNNGLNKLENNKITRYINNPNDSNSISENSILALYEDKDKNIWAGTYAGLNRFNNASNTFTHFKKDLGNPQSLSNNYVFSFCEDSAGNFWVGTGGGLNLFNRSTGTFRGYTEKNGISNSVICGILPDVNGNLWLSTKKGLSEFNPTIETFKNFNSDDGLQSNMFTEGAYLKTSYSDLYFGGINGFTLFNPDQLKYRDYQAPVILTALSYFSDKMSTTLDISGVNDVELSYNDNIISFEFASFDYYSPKKNSFSYMLEGFEKEWKNSGHISKALYTNLDPGKYTFRVKGTNSDGIWSNKEAFITLTITPPFWKTWWFYSLVLLTIAGIVFFISSQSIRNKVRAMLELEKARETEREKIRLEASRDYHDELGHKLTRISIYSRRISKKLGASSNGITGDLKGIMDVSESLQSGAKDLVWSLNPDEDTLYDFAVRLKDFGNSIFENTGITFTMHGISDDMKNIKLNMKVKRHLIFIFKESMNNTLKYSQCTLAELTFNHNGSKLEISFDDNGKGFDTDQISAGYGLKNIHNRAKQINADIDINSAPGTGTKINFKIGV